jgi:predicted nucleic acid-binding protein
VNRHYWDSRAFLGWLKQEPGKVGKCRPVIEEAERGKLVIVTSSLTLAEVLWLKGKDPIPKEDRRKVRQFFEHSWIILYDLDRKIAEASQDVVWDYGVKPKDAVHVATAIDAKVTCLETFDGPLIAKSGAIGTPPLTIHEPGTSLPPTLEAGLADDTGLR